MIAVEKEGERRALPYYLCNSEMGTMHSRTANQESM